MNERLLKIEENITEMEEYRIKRTRQQLISPLDSVSEKIIHKDMLIPSGLTVQPSGLVTLDTVMQISVNGKFRRVPAQFIEF